MTKDENTTRIHQNFIGIYIISLAKGMENIFKIESDILLFEYSQKNVIFTTIINQKVMKLFSITKGKKKCSSIIILFYFLLIYESASKNSAI